MALADHSRQADRSQIDKRHTKTAIKDAKHRVAGGDAQIAPQCQLHSTRHCISFHCSEYGLAEEHPRGPHRPLSFFLSESPAALGDFTQIKTSTECPAGAGQNRNTK